MKLGIISLGLIGGSLLKSLAQAFTPDECDIFAVTRNAETIKQAKKYTKNISKDLFTLKDCDVIFVCSPMNKTLDILDALESIIPKSAIVADVCSLKEFVTEKERPYIFVGTHPMAGTENSGFEASFKELFEGAKWVLTPNNKTPAHAINTLKNLIQKTGAQPIIATPKEHDEAVAMISHMPLLVAQALVNVTADNELALRLASSGFRDMTRLALSNTEMANDMLVLNNKNIKDSLQNLKVNIDKILKSDYAQTSVQIKQLRQNLYNKDGKNIYN